MVVYRKGQLLMTQEEQILKLIENNKIIITNKMVNIASSIMKKISKLDNYKDLNKMPVLRRNNRIKSIHSSLAIEANSLSFNQVKSIIDGKPVIGPKNEIQEVQNAYNAYLKIKEVNPYSLNDLKKIHGILTYLTVQNAGKFRTGGEGVFDEAGNCIFVCPPPEQIDILMIDEVLEGLIEGVYAQTNHISVYVKKLLDVMELGVNYTTLELMELLEIKYRLSFRENYLSPAIDNGVVKMTCPKAPTSRNQRYYKV